MLRGKCAACGTTKTHIVKTNKSRAVNGVSSGGDLVGSLNSFTKNIKLPGQKFPGEIHLPGMNFAGPGTRLDIQSNENGTP